MTTQVSTKVRLVRCPQCLLVLAELPEVPVYQCGGCSTILQAKNRKLETNNTELSSQETDPVPKGQQDNVLGQKEARSSNHDLTGSLVVESLPETDNIRCQDEHDNCRELCQDNSVSHGLSSSSDVTCSQTEDSPIEDKVSLGNICLGQNLERYESKHHDDNGEWTAGPSFSSELPSSGEITHEDEAYTPEASEHVNQHNQCQSHQDSRKDQEEGGDSQRVWQKGDNLVYEIQNFPEHEDLDFVLPERIKNNHVPPGNDEKSHSFSADQNGESLRGIEHAGLAHENDIVSPSVEQVNDDSEVLPIFRSSSREKNMTPSDSDSIVASQGPLNGSLVSFYLTSDDEQMDHSPREVTHNFERVSSTDTLGRSHLANLSSELNVKHGPVNGYPTYGSYYAYDGSESSYDGTDDQFREHFLHPLRKNKNVDYIRTTKVLRKDGFRGNNVVISEPERTYWATSSPHHAMKSSHWGRGRSIESNRYTSRHRMRLDKQGDVFGLPSTSIDTLPGHRRANTPGYKHNLLPPRPRTGLSDCKPSYSEPDKIDLLRTVCELKDQLNKMHFTKGRSNRRFLDRNFASIHYDHLAPEGELYTDPSRPCAYNPRKNHARGCAERCNVSRLAFSGEAAHYRHQVSCSCLHCCPQDWHYSAQLPSRSMHCKNGDHVVHTDYNCCSISNSLSAHHYTSSELSLWGCDRKSDDQRLDEIKQIHLREKYHTAKRHLRPIAGGAPLVACYHCSELLQLPADFLLFKKRYHRLMCNACRKVLKFSLLKGTHIVPFMPDASAPPPSEADDYNDAARQRNLEPCHSRSCLHVEPVSCSDDYGRSFGRSCSTEGEASVILSSFDQVERNSYNRKMPSGSPYEPMEDRKMKGILKEPLSENEGSLKSVESAGPSSKMPKWRKVTSEIFEEVLPSSNSPLHRLMGYSSPSQVLDR